MTCNDTTRKIRSLLAENRMTQSEIARKVGVRRQRVSQVRQERDKNPYVNFDGSKLRERREKKGWSMRELARRLGVNASQVTRWESGQQKPWPNLWRKIARTLVCTVEDLEKEGTQALP